MQSATYAAVWTVSKKLHHPSKCYQEDVMQQFHPFRILHFHFNFDFIAPPFARFCNFQSPKCWQKMHHPIKLLAKLDHWFSEISRLMEAHHPLHNNFHRWESQSQPHTLDCCFCCCCRCMDAAPTCQSSLFDPLVSSGSHFPLMHG